MAQGFSCHCSSVKCLGWVQGAEKLSIEQLEGKGEDKRWISKHIRQLVADNKDHSDGETKLSANGHVNRVNGKAGEGREWKRRGVTSRTLSGEMSGDTETA
jgi:hypothetical protein